MSTHERMRTCMSPVDGSATAHTGPARNAVEHPLEISQPVSHSLSHHLLVRQSVTHQQGLAEVPGTYHTRQQVVSHTWQIPKATGQIREAKRDSTGAGRAAVLLFTRPGKLLDPRTVRLRTQFTLYW